MPAPTTPAPARGNLQILMTMFVLLLLVTSIYLILMKGWLIYYLTNFTTAAIIAAVVLLLFRYKAPELQGSEYFVFIAGFLGFILADQISSYLKFSIIPLDVTSTGSLQGTTPSFVVLFLLLGLIVAVVITQFGTKYEV